MLISYFRVTISRQAVVTPLYLLSRRRKIRNYSKYVKGLFSRPYVDINLAVIIIEKTIKKISEYSEIEAEDIAFNSGEHEEKVVLLFYPRNSVLATLINSYSLQELYEKRIFLWFSKCYYQWRCV